METKKVKKSGSSDIVRVTGQYEENENVIVMSIEEYKDLLKKEQ